MKQTLCGWGRHLTVDAEVVSPAHVEGVLRWVSEGGERKWIARGLGRSYGDSSLAKHVLSTTRLDALLRFDATNGLLTCEAGVTLAEILSVFVPKGWFLPVTPGTKFVTVGGAIASDVHGKNHHLEGTFGEHVVALKVVTPADGLLVGSREVHAPLFYATCGGMGLTGVITEATFRLQPIRSGYIRSKTIKTAHLEETLNQLAQHHQVPYSVAWIDCLASGKTMGRSLVMLGEHVEEGEALPRKAAKWSIPVDLPSFLLNRFSVRAFNALYYHHPRSQQTERVVHYEPFFYPLDGIQHWNRMYGKKGFAQYQFVLPKASGLTGIQAVLKRIAASQRGSFLAVLKIFGKANRHLLAFPIEGYTLALDFKWERHLLPFLNELDRMVLDHGGRTYLTKDAHMSAETFRQSYPAWEDFCQIREKHGAHRVFHSLQSQRLGI